MPESLHVKPEEIDTPEKREKFTVSVVGCEREGVLCAAAFAEAGYRVLCTDANQSVVKRLEKGKSSFVDDELETKLRSLTRTGKLGATSEIKSAVMQSDIIVLANTAKLDAKRIPDYSEIEATCKQVGTALRRGALVIYAGIAGFGFTEGIIKEELENASGFKVGEDFGLAYSPIQMLEEHMMGSMHDQQLQVAATEKVGLDSASTVLETITKKGVEQISTVKTAELAFLFAAAQRDTNVALANELAIFCENSGQDYSEILKLLERNKPDTRALPTISEEKNRDAVYLLLESAENLNIKLRVPALARQTNEDMVRHAVNLAQDALRSCGKTLRRARIGLLGAPKPKTAAYAFWKALEGKGARITIYDPKLPESELADLAPVFKKTLNETIEGTDCIVILTRQDQFSRLNFKKLRVTMKTPAAIVDLVGVVEQDKVEKEEFVYRSIGKGTRKK